MARALICTTLLLSGCGFPRDVGTTLDDVRGGVLKVGITDNPPWTSVPDRGAEAELVRRLAERTGSTVEWYPGSESALMAALKDRVLDLVVGGLEADAPWIEKAALTRPYVTMRTVIAAAGPVPDDLTGVRVGVRGGTADVAAVAAKGATVAAYPEISGKEGIPVAVGEWRVDALGLTESGHDVGEADHVWAVPPGENAWQTEVERFLLDLSHEQVTDLLVAAEELP
ncbi:transporter substrate-binding domain-containing protein [Actinoplanes sp. NPDC023714]|uniref:transporter substrate-binding domain-containing protein n=1 Tax=Actinoplanes sp. NPDC023714 TaxID=3154322 RepID=UPI0033D40EC4